MAHRKNERQPKKSKSRSESVSQHYLNSCKILMLSYFSTLECLIKAIRLPKTLQLTWILLMEFSFLLTRLSFIK